jgi:hypothetical protein
VASAYEFNCDMSVDEMLQVLNKKGPWKWAIRDSHWYGDYLNCRPEEGVRVRIHHPAECFPGGTQDRRDYYTALFTIESKRAPSRDAVDHILRELLAHVHARNLREIENYE